MVALDVALRVAPPRGTPVETAAAYHALLHRSLLPSPCRLLCVELPRRAPPPEQGRPPPTPIFRSLRVAGEEVAEPGLVEEAAARQSRA